MQEDTGTSITEQGVHSIYVGQEFSKGYTYGVLDGAAKWFEDELGQRWVKFVIDAGRQARQTIVVRADLVMYVVYEPRPLSPSAR